nr:hypothetical protein CJ211_02115 [Gardnerella vaginalis]PMC54062.1 hypothetical protein CJ210_03740 [Gardnerella vaginalis]
MSQNKQNETLTQYAICTNVRKQPNRDNNAVTHLHQCFKMGKMRHARRKQVNASNSVLKQVVSAHKTQPSF